VPHPSFFEGWELHGRFPRGFVAYDRVRTQHQIPFDFTESRPPASVGMIERSRRGTSAAEATPPLELMWHE
jgi:hypothetical protein